MNARESVSHEQAIELLPWLVNNSLDEREKEAVLEHAQACVICRRELTNLQQLQNSISDTSSTSPLPEPDLRNINARIDALIDRQNWGRELWSRLREALDSSWRIAFAAQTVALIALAAVLFWPEPRSEEYTTLTQVQNLPDGQYLRVVFSPDLQQSQLTNLLDKHKLTIVGGPSIRGVYTLGVTNTSAYDDILLSGLQDDPDVLFAQPVIIGADR